jgi:hypothetical protein
MFFEKNSSRNEFFFSKDSPKITIVVYNMKGFKDFFTFIFWIMPNLARCITTSATSKNTMPHTSHLIFTWFLNFFLMGLFFKPNILIIILGFLRMWYESLMNYEDSGHCPWQTTFFFVMKFDKKLLEPYLNFINKICEPFYEIFLQFWYCCHVHISHSLIFIVVFLCFPNVMVQANVF